MELGSRVITSEVVDEIKPHVPKTIHFIWAGGLLLMPDKNRKIVLEWARQNIPDGFEVWLWVDKSSFPGGMDKLKTQYSLCFNDSKKDSEQIIDFSDPNCPFKLKDITDEGVSNEHIFNEIKRLLPNYGASSDLLRYCILLNFGGAYFDSDVKPSGTKLIELNIFGGIKSHCLVINNNSQNSKKAGNDSFVCSQNHPLMLLIFKTAMNRCVSRGEDPYTQIPEAYCSDDKAFMRSDTIGRTGPGVIQLICLRNKSSNQILFGLDKYTIDEGNDRSWLGAGIRNCNSINEAFLEVQWLIAHEAKHFRMLKLDTHINNLIAHQAKYKTDSITDDTIKEMVLSWVAKNIDMQNIDIVQINFSNPETFEFCCKFNLLDKIPVLLQHPMFQAACSCATKQILLQDLLDNLTPEEAKPEIARYFKEVINLANGILCALEKFPPKNDENLVKNLKLLNNAIKMYIKLLERFDELDVYAKDLHKIDEHINRILHSSSLQSRAESSTRISIERSDSESAQQIPASQSKIETVKENPKPQDDSSGVEKKRSCGPGGCNIL